MTLKGDLTDLVGQSPAIQALLVTIKRLTARSQTAMRPPSVLLQGETGSGKGLLASLLHRVGPRASGRFIDVNCAAIPDNLLESELFGFERGAFTDARRAKPGLFQAAHRGTIFLDEIALLPEALQAKLLKAIEERMVRRLGATEAEPADAWVISATNADLQAAVRARRFREDLYHRLAVMTISIPPLRERGDDIMLLATHFLTRACADHGLPARTLAPDAVAKLTAYHWPGNVRELANVMERVALLSDQPRIDATLLDLDVRGPAPAPAPEPSDLSLDTVVRTHIQRVMAETGNNISRTAALLGITRNTLRAHLDKLGLRPTATGARPARAPRVMEVQAPPLVRVPATAATATLRWERRLVTVLRVVLEAPADTPSFQIAPLLDELIVKAKSFGARVEDVAPLALVVAFGVEPMEDAPIRATHSALAILKRVQRARAEAVTGLHARLGLHAGSRMIAQGGDVTGMDAGDRKEVWAILDGLVARAPADAVVADAAAARLIERRFALDPPRGGAGAPPQVHRVLGHERSGFEVGGRLLSGFVGRDRELAMLDELFARAESGRGQVVGIVGEPGVGKSRLLHEFRGRLGAARVTWREGRCRSYGTTMPYMPIIDVVRQNFRLGDLESGEVIDTKVRSGLAALGLDPKAMAPYLMHLLGYKEGTETLTGQSPEAIKARTVDALRQVSLVGSRRRPVILAVEDLHWIDRTSEETLALFVEMLGGGRFLLMTTYRPGYQPPWLGRSYVSQMVLDHLSPADSLRVVRSVVSEDVLPAALAETIVNHAGGVPFFLEELARAVAEHPDLRSEVEVPDTIQGVVSARLHRLPEDDRGVLQAASVVGKDVDLAVLAEVADVPDAVLSGCLRHLQAAEFLHETLALSRRQFTFKHALTHDVVYRGLADDARRVLHLRVAESIERLTPDVATRQPELLAHHYTAGGRTAEAVGYWYRAGQHALQRSANVEAVAHLDRGLGLIARLPATAERGQQELALQMAMSRALVMTKGFGAQEVGRALARARELCRPMEQEAAVFPVFHGLWLFYIGRADFAAAEELAGQLLAVADRQALDRLRVPAYVALGVPLFYRGEFVQALSHLSRAIELYDVADSPMQRTTFGQDQGVGALGFTAWGYALLGRCDEAAVFADRAIHLARETGHPFSLALALHLASLVRIMRGESAQAGAQGEEQLALSREHRFPFFIAGGFGFVGWALVQAGQRERGLEMMRQGARAYRATGAEVGLSHLAHLADTLVEAGEIDEALVTVSDALATAGRTGEGLPLAELHRVRGEALLRSEAGSMAAAEACFETSLAVARRQHARLLELRAAISMARLRIVQERVVEGRDLLAPLYASLSEGAKCTDLRSAAALLEQLG